jgi:hypothetical protein
MLQDQLVDDAQIVGHEAMEIVERRLARAAAFLLEIDDHRHHANPIP